LGRGRRNVKMHDQTRAGAEISREVRDVQKILGNGGHAVIISQINFGISKRMSGRRAANQP
jgi:hypothetical protein